MKKTNFLYASAIMMAMACGVVSCTVEDNPAPDPVVPTEPEIPEVKYESIIYDFAAVPDGTKLGNLGGSAANGQAFYGWEKADKIDSKRQDYKGYTLIEGIDLPEVCHVWCRSDRYDQDNSFLGGFNCRNDREMAIDGLSAGSIVQIFYNPAMVNKTETTDLKDVPFQAWDGWVNANPTGNGNGVFVLNESTGQPYGDPSVINYADLSAFTKLIVVATDGTPRFIFNRDVNDGQWNADEAESHLIEYPKGDEAWSAKYFTVEEIEGGKRYIVDLAQMVKDKGYAHLHAIKGANWANCTVTSMTLETTVKEPSDAKMIWAIGVSEEGPRVTAEIDGVEAVSGETEIASGATISVKTVTPAENGTGYFVFKVKKGMAITKVVIMNPIIEAE